MTTDRDEMLRRTRLLRLWGLVARWDEVKAEPWLEPLLDAEEREQKRRSLERRISSAKLGSFKPMADFDWDHPRKIDRALIEELFTLEFLLEPASAVIFGANGLGKTMIAQNLCHHAVMNGHTVLFTSASEMLNELAAQDGAAALKRKLRKYTQPDLLGLDEVGYLSYDNRHADLLFEVVSRRYQEQNAIVLTTNRPFGEWSEVFPNASCVVTLVDRLCHRAEIVAIEGDSYRVKEAKERAAKRRASRHSGKKKTTKSRPKKSKS